MKFSIKDFFSKCDQNRRKLHFLCSVSQKFVLKLVLGNVARRTAVTALRELTIPFSGHFTFDKFAISRKNHWKERS